jgi:hypothetical protein
VSQLQLQKNKLVSKKRCKMNPTGKGGFGERKQDINRKGRNKKEREEQFKNIALSAITPEEFEYLWRNVILVKARKGEYAFVKLVLDYYIGPPIEKKEISGSDGGAIFVTLKDKDD